MTAALVTVGAVAVVVLAFLLWFRSWLVVVDVDGSSMEPTFHTGDRVLVRRTSLARVGRGDVVVVERPDGPGVWRRSPAGRRVAGQPWMIKRAAALPGQPVPAEVIGVVTETTVPEGHLVLLGDNIASSYDSRSCGFFPSTRLLGVVVRRMSS